MANLNADAEDVHPPPSGRGLVPVRRCQLTGSAIQPEFSDSGSRQRQRSICFDRFNLNTILDALDLRLSQNQFRSELSIVVALHTAPQDGSAIHKLASDPSQCGSSSSQTPPQVISHLVVLLVYV